MVAQAITPRTPNSYKEAVSLPEVDKWKLVMKEELEVHFVNHTFDLVLLPQGHTAIGTCWLYKIKQWADRTVNCYKVRWVVKGFTQRPGIDFDKTYAPIVRPESLRLLIAWVTAHDLKIHLANIITTFLHSTLTKENYI